MERFFKILLYLVRRHYWHILFFPIRLVRTILITFIVVFILFFTSLFLYFRFQIAELAHTYPLAHYQSNKVTYTFEDKAYEGWTPLSKLKKSTIGAFIVSEDGAYFHHPGLDFEQIQKVVDESIKKGKPKRGASTITQQVVKNLFLSREKSLSRKTKEAVLALLLDRRLSKERILEIYLNVIEFGEGLYGISNAANYYFHKSPSSLTPREAAFLAMLLPNPKKYSVSYKRRELSSFARRITESILNKLRLAGYLSQEALEIELSSRFSWEPKEIAPPSLEGDEESEESQLEL